jgi:hypothetical protein
MQFLQPKPHHNQNPNQDAVANPDMEYPEFVETQNYQPGDIVKHDNRFWKAVTNYVAREVGDLSMAPSDTNTDWLEVTTIDTQLVPEYKLIAKASTPINTFDKVSMDVNGNIQKYPATGGEGYSNFTDKTVDLHNMVYIGNNTGVVIYTEDGVNKLYIRPGVAQSDGSILWGSELSIDSDGPIQKIVSTHINNSYSNITWIEDSSSSLKSMNITTDGSIIGVGSIITPGDAGSRAQVTNAGACYDDINNHLIWAWYEDGQSIYNNYADVNETTITPSGKNDIDMAFGSDVQELEVAIERENIIVQAMSSTGGVYWREAAWDNGRWDQEYSSLSSVAVVVSEDALSLGGIQVNSGAIFGQVQLSLDTWQTYYAGYFSGNTIFAVNAFGGTIEGQEACLVNTDSGLGYNIVFDKNNVFKVYQGSSTNPQAGYQSVYTGAMYLDTTNPYEEYVIMFGSKFAIILNGSEAIKNDIYFIDSNATRTDNYIGNAANSAEIGEDAEVFIGLPMINHPMSYSRGDIFYLGPYKYQAIDEHRVLMIVEETIFP